MQWRWAVGAGAQHNIGAPVAVATGGWARVWNTSTVAVNQRPPDGAVTISALVTDMAGNVLTITTPAVVDNTAPDVKAVLTAPPAVAGSPTLIWTPAHDAVGITRYEVLRGGNVIATVASIAGAQTFSFSDKSAPDQATSTYIVRACDGAAHSVDSNAVPVLVDSTAVTRRKGPDRADADVRGARAHLVMRRAAFAVNHYDVYRDGLLVGSTPGAGATFTDATATEGTHDYAVLARDAACPAGRALRVVQGGLRQDRADERRRADRAGARERTGQPGLAGRRRCAVRRRRIRRSPHGRRGRARPPPTAAPRCARRPSPAARTPRQPPEPGRTASSPATPRATSR